MLSNTRQWENEQCRTIWSGTAKCRTESHKAKEGKPKQSKEVQSQASPSKALILSIAVKIRILARGSGHESSSRNPSWRSLNPPLQTRGLQAQESKCRIPKPASQPQELNCRKSNPTIQTSNASAGIQTLQFQPRHPNPGIQKQDSKIKGCKSRKSSLGLQTQHFRSMNANTGNQT